MQDRKLCFNDILLTPQYSKLDSRTTPDISTTIGNIKLSTPIISAPMDSITDEEMVVCMDKLGCLGILSRYINIDPDEELGRQIRKIQSAKNRGTTNVGCAIGIKNDDITLRTRCLLKAGCNVLCIDVAHGDHEKMYTAIDSVRKLKNEFEFVLMAGNVCTPEATIRFARHGVDAIKVGIGPGAVCTTRITTGFGCPQMSAILECASAVKEIYPRVAIIADGGIRNSGDMVKCLWGGANACMIGYLLAGTSSTPRINGRMVYRGMSCRMASGRPDIAPEGIEIEVADQGQTEEVVGEYIKGIRSGLAMGGAENLDQLRSNVKHVVVSQLSLSETMPKDS